MRELNQSDLKAVEALIGYEFKDENLLKKALTHQSATPNPLDSYQRMEFLGDSILDFVAADYLCAKYPTAEEGELTRMRANIVSKFPLASIAQATGLVDFLRVHEGSFDISEKVYSDTIESMTAAIYLDSGSFDLAKKFVLDFVIARIARDEFKINDFKSRLLELAASKDSKVEFEVLSVKGEPHNPVFECAVLWNGSRYGTAEAKSKKTAEQECARQALLKLGKR